MLSIVKVKDVIGLYFIDLLFISRLDIRMTISVLDYQERLLLFYVCVRSSRISQMENTN